MSKQRKHLSLVCVIGAGLIALAIGSGAARAQSSSSIKIGVLVPLTGPLATPGKDMDDAVKLFWEQNNYQAGGRKIELVTADTTCNPDQALTQARRVVHQDKVHLILGPLCGHEGPAVAQVSKETGIPVVMDPAGADSVTQWDRTPTVVRTATSSSQIGHPFGDYLYKELGARNVTFIGQDYTFGHEVTLGAVQTFKAAGGKVAKIVWNPIGTKDYGPTVASIDPSSDAVVAVVVGADRVRLFEAWFNFGMDKKFKIYGGYWMHQDVLPQLDERAIGMIGNSLHYAAGLDTPENNAFTAAFA
ncbi:MAG TPA: ABC transporter substrate-binding protein, partial [Hyphomicrobiaceae bacterium]|nr:ABC transporter substrate-binding protein [Hyphomicrobiaceae bacterium]